METLTKNLEIKQPKNYLYLEEKRNYLLQELAVKNSSDIYTKWLERTLLKDIPEGVQTKLATSNLSQEEFTILLSKEISLNDKASEYILSSEWFKVYEEGLILARETADQPIEEVDITLAFKPFALWAWNSIKNTLHKNGWEKYISSQSFLVSNINSLLNTLNKEAIRSIVLELHIAKLRGEIDGDTPEERFICFIRNTFLNLNNLEEFYNEYAVLLRTLATKTLYFVNNLEEFMERYVQDFELLGSTFKIPSTDTINMLVTDLGDTHEQGKSVINVILSSGVELIYKPKNLLATKRFHQLLDWINLKKQTIDLKYHKSIAKDGYGWEEKVITKDCKSTIQVEQYYERFGSLLSVVHLLKGCDIHLENIIASGDSPYIIDLETLLHQYVPFAVDKNAEFLAKDKISDSVLGTALLPMVMFKSAKSKGLDMSALNGREQDLPFKVLQLKGRNTDDMQFTYDYGKSIKGKNIPHLDNNQVEVGEYIEKIMKGFKETYNLFLDFQEELLSEDGPITLFKDLDIRIIARNTQTYANFLQEATHPDYTRDALEREILFDRLWYYPFKNKNIIKSEIEDMLNGDIPFFKANTNSTSLVDSRGKEIPNVYLNTTYDLLRNNLENISIETMNEQLELIKLSTMPLTKKQAKKYTKVNRQHIIEANKENNYNQEIFINKADLIAEYMYDRAIFSEDRKTVSWINKQVSEEGFGVILPIESHLYNGILGLALFFLYNGKITGNQKYYDISKACINTASQSVTFSNYNEISAFYGIGSLISPMYQYKKITGDNFFDELFDKYLDLIDEHFTKDISFDFLSGSSGLIHVFLTIYEENNDVQFLIRAKGLADHIIQHIKMDGEFTLIDFKDERVNLGGFSHGASGFAYTFARLSAYDEKFNKFTDGFLAFDKSLYNGEVHGWKDLRKEDRKDANQWCHGSTGIGLSRILIRNEHQGLKVFIDKVLNGYQKTDDGLCHGNMGDIELLLTYAEKMQKDEFHFFSKVLVYETAKNIDLSGKEKFSSDLGLFNGLAGIGYQLLRVSHPNEVPSVLALNRF
ncbi:type 2 lanthipeptide synthetase LanM family protein [Psychrobacillus sp. FSL K6-2836]|uniref:type 2 lanthipeptide synthetase LanM family protein n=1 Tax=Psychrobacillus sp. FSL K6-2836 TaxID=2921548 RepID=UPI0030F91232